MNQRMPLPMQRGQDFLIADGPHRGGDSLEWVIFALLLLLILLVVALLVVSVMRPPMFRGPRRGMHGPPAGRPWGRPEPLSIARMRYARGEIGRDEYLRLAEDLGREPGPPPPPPPPG